MFVDDRMATPMPDHPSGPRDNVITAGRTASASTRLTRRAASKGPASIAPDDKQDTVDDLLVVIEDVPHLGEGTGDDLPQRHPASGGSSRPITG